MIYCLWNRGEITNQRYSSITSIVHWLQEKGSHPQCIRRQTFIQQTRVNVKGRIRWLAMMFIQSEIFGKTRPGLTKVSPMVHIHKIKRWKKEKTARRCSLSPICIIQISRFDNFLTTWAYEIYFISRNRLSS